MSQSSSNPIINAIEEVQVEEVLLKATVQKNAFKRLRSEVEQNAVIEKPRKLSKQCFFDLKLEQNSIVEGPDFTNLKKQSPPTFLECDEDLKKVTAFSQLLHSYNSMKSYEPKSDQEEHIKRVYLDMMAKHVEKSWMFAKESLDMYSEQDFSIKFWSGLFETYIGRQKDILLNWGEKMSPICKSKGLDFKFDLRILAARDEGYEDIGLGEAAKQPTPSKYYNDRVKGAIASKAYLNHFVSQVPHINHTTIPKIKIPFVQIMGLDATITTLSLSKKKQYTFNEVFELSYPRSLEQIKNGQMQNVVKALVLLEELIQNLKSIYTDGQIDNSNQMARMKKRQPKKPKFNPDSWTTDIVWSSEDNTMVNSGGECEEE